MTLTQNATVSDFDCSLVNLSVHEELKDAIKLEARSGESLQISFKRTVRVPDGDGDSELPPSMGTFPLYSINDYRNTLPAAMALKGGLFLPMYQREAMWICFKSQHRFAIKIELGGVNAISGEPMDEDAATKLRRLNRLANKQSIQDYVVTPEQLWLDGIASQDGRVRQFVAMPLGSGYSVEAQVTGKELVGGLQFEITPAEIGLRESHGSGISPPVSTIFLKSLTGKVIRLNCVSPLTLIEEIKGRIENKEGIPQDQQRLVYKGQQLEDSHGLGYYNIPHEGIITLVLRLRGGGTRPPTKEHELSIAPGGYIKQCIIEDKNPASIWQRDQTICFNVQILNSQTFREVTGRDPPDTPISAATYAKHGLPFFQIYNEESTVKGDFEGVKSVNAMDKAKGKQGGDDESSYKNPVVLLDPDGVKMGFRPVAELRDELQKMNAVQF